MTASTSENEEGKQWSQFVVVIISTMCTVTAGLHTGWPAPSLPKLLSDEFPFDVTNDEGSYITIIGSIGNFFGGFIGNYTLDKIGRKGTILFIALPQLISFMMIILSYEMMELLYVARFMGGIGEGMSVAVVLLYIGEIAEPKIRGTLCSLLSISLYLGVVLVNVVGSYLSIRWTAVTFISFPVVFVALFYKMPESPYYLLMKDQEEKAAKALRFLRRKTDVSEELTKLKADVQRQMSEAGTYRDMLAIESNRKALMVTAGARFFQITTGVAAFNLYLQILLKDSTASLNPAIGSTIILALQVIMTAVSTLIVDRWGRKPLLLFSIIGGFINLTLQTIFFILKEYTSVDTSVIDWFPLFMMILHIVIYSIGLGVVVSVLTGEMFSASVKGKLMCVVSGFYAIFTLLSTKYYQATADAVGLTVPFATFCVLTFLGVLFFYYLVPETKGKTLEEIQQNLKSKPKKVPIDQVRF